MNGNILLNNFDSDDRLKSAVKIFWIKDFNRCACRISLNKFVHLYRAILKHIIGTNDLNVSINRKN
jgi:hypothetical protein